MKSTMLILVVAMLASARDSALAAPPGALPENAIELPPAWPREGARKLLENDRGAMWNVEFANGVGSAWHRHAYEFAGVELATAAFSVTSPDGATGIYAVSRGQMWILPKGLTHMEQGLTTPGRNILLVDVKEAASPRYRNGSGMPDGFAAANAWLVNSNGHVSQGDLRLSPDVPERESFFSRDVFVACIDGGKIRITEAGGPPRVLDLKSGEGLFLKGGTARKLEAAQGGVRLMLVELK